MKRITTILLLFAMMATLTLSSCSSGSTGEENPPANNDTAQTEETVSEETEPPETELTDNVPADLKFDGESLDFYTDSYDRQFSLIFVEELTGDVLNDARYNMETKMEERFDITITEEAGATPWEFVSTVRQLIFSNDDKYDVYTNMDMYAIENTLQECYYAVSDLPYVDLEAEYWYPKATENFRIGKKTYFAISPFNIYGFQSTDSFMLNTNLAEDLGFGNEIYETVVNGTWTYDTVMRYAEQCYVDENGNGETDMEDTYGLTQRSTKRSSQYAIVGTGCYNEILGKDEDGYLTYSVSEKFYDVLEMVYELCQQQYVYFKEAELKMNYPKTLLYQAEIGKLTLYRDSTIDIMALPLPKYDEMQAGYSCRTSDNYFSMVPVTNKNLELCGAVLEAMACESYKEIVPAYTEVTLQTKMAINAEASEMMKLILDSRNVFIAEAFLFEQWGDGAFLDDFMTQGSSSPASFIAKRETYTKKIIEGFNKFFKGQD